MWRKRCDDDVCVCFGNVFDPLYVLLFGKKKRNRGMLLPRESEGDKTTNLAGLIGGDDRAG